MTSELDVTTLKPSIVYGNFKDGVFGTLAKAVKKPIMPIFGNGNSLFRPIHIEDLAILIDKCLNSKITIGKEYDVGGPNLISFKNIALKIRTIRTGNKKIRFIYLPSKVGLLSAKLFSYMPSVFLVQPACSRILAGVRAGGGVIAAKRAAAFIVGAGVLVFAVVFVEVFTVEVAGVEVAGIAVAIALIEP
jgi:uncharacterized protein YbjT (DUF2867 family)